MYPRGVVSPNQTLHSIAEQFAPKTTRAQRGGRTLAGGRVGLTNGEP
jgi:hypothetical protein